MTWLDHVTFDGRGLVTVVTQDAASGEVLMLAHATREALERTAATGRAHYWSRSRSELWLKGETSGHVQEVMDIRIDCDGDAILYRVRQTGPACHTGEASCFHRQVSAGTLEPAPDPRHILTRIESILAARHAERPEGSYTTYLFEKGIDKILKKVGEEATETVIAAKNPGVDELRSEAADLIFHLLVLLRARGIELDTVWDELGTRFGAAPRPGSAAPPPSRAADGT